MAEFLTTNGVSSQIEHIIMNAKKELTLVSPFLQLSKTFFERLKDANENNVTIRIIYGKDELKPNEKNSLATLSHVELYYFDNLHAKCYFNEEQMVITSMNMYEFSEKNNREMGVLVDRIKDQELFERASNETKSIIRSSERINLAKQTRSLFAKKNPPENKKTQTTRGYCIRCQERIDYNPEKPYCWDCYTSWAAFENPDYTETACHRCGEFEKTSMRIPQCKPCWTAFVSEL
jgi:phosphatidylserine/phosphatidylglycerophosphate/cardiolipin synthase-like enzyme